MHAAIGPAIAVILQWPLGWKVAVTIGLLVNVAVFASFFRRLLAQFIPILGWSLPGAGPALVGVLLFQTTEFNGDILVEAAAEPVSRALLFGGLTYWSMQCWTWSRIMIRLANCEKMRYPRRRPNIGNAANPKPVPSLAEYWRSAKYELFDIGPCPYGPSWQDNVPPPAPPAPHFDRDARLRWWLSLWMPRIVGVLPVAAAWYGVTRVATPSEWLSITLYFLGFGTVVLLLMLARMPLVVILRGGAAAPRPGAPPPPKTLALWWQSLLTEAPVWRWLVVVLLALPVIFAALMLLDPIRLPQQIGPGAVVPLALGSMTAPMAVLFSLGLFFKVPVIAMAAIFLGLVVANTEFSEITTKAPGRTNLAALGPSAPKPTVASRPTIDEWASNWLRLCGASATTGGELRVVLVATAGGAARAGLWTSQVLARLQDDTGSLHKHLFAIGGVSGGALGSVVHLADLAGTGTSCTSEIPSEGLAERSRAFFAHDFLSPSLARHLSSDTYKRVLLFPLRWAEPEPSAFLRDLAPLDRAAILEQAWVQGWETAGRKHGHGLDAGRHSRFGLNSSLLDLYHDNPGLPLLMTQGTDGSTGRPTITSAASIPERHLPVGFDLLHLLGADVSLATAASNAARFPYISPAGAIRAREPTTAPKATTPEQGYIVDGGYFENFGVLSVLIAADALRNAYAAWTPDNSPKLRILFVQISSTPDSHLASLPRCDRIPKVGAPRLGPTPSEITRAGNAPTDQLLAPLQSIIGTQQGHAVAAAWILAHEACGIGRRARPETAGYVHFRIPGKPSPGNLPTERLVPLNWVLPCWAQNYLYAGNGTPNDDCSEGYNPGDSAWAHLDNRIAAAVVQAFLFRPADAARTASAPATPPP